MMLANMMTPIGLVFVMLLYTAEGFASNPRNQTVYEGDNVRFTCGSPYMNQCSSPYFSWHRSTISQPLQKYLSGCYHITSTLRGHMTVQLDEHTRELRLDIQNVEFQDDGLYWCRYYNPSLHSSDKASLTVIPKPRSSPSCVTQPRKIPTVGETVSLNCTLTGDDLPNIITWYVRSPTGDFQLIPSQGNRRRRAASLTHVLQKTDIMKEFTCVVGIDPYTGQTCSVTPLRIQIPTSTYISPPLVTVTEGEKAVFTLIMVAPSQSPVFASEYRWRIYKTNSSLVEVNNDTLSGYNGRYNMIQNTLQILAVSADFHNSEITCTAVYHGIYHYSLNRSRLQVLSVTTVLSPTAIAQETEDPSVPKTKETLFGTNTPNQHSTGSSIMATTTQHVPKQDVGNKTQKLPIGVLVGGALAILLLVVTIILLVCFLVRNKRKVRRPRQVVAGSPVQESARQDTVTAGSSVETDLSYLNLSSDDQSRPTQPNLSSEETTECETVLYAIPDKTMRGEVKNFTMTPPANKTSTGSGFVSLPRDLEPASSQDKNGHGSHEMVVYAQVNKNVNRYPKPTADKPASQDEDTEELDYADLDFNQVPQGATGIDAIYAKPHKGPKK